jgi:hypothetical protein
MENKYLIGLGGIAVIGFLAYSLTEENKRNKALREKEVLAKETEMANKLSKTQAELKAKLDAEAKAKALADSRYTPAQATAKALGAISIISDYLSKLTPEELNLENQNIGNNLTVLVNNRLQNNDNLKYKTVRDFVSDFKSNGVTSLNKFYKKYFAENDKKRVDGFVNVYPKLFLWESFEFFPLIVKVKRDFDFTTEERIWLSENWN